MPCFIACFYAVYMSSGQCLTRHQERELLIYIVEQGTFGERIWLPLLRLIHKYSKKLISDMNSLK